MNYSLVHRLHNFLLTVEQSKIELIEVSIRIAKPFGNTKLNHWIGNWEDTNHKKQMLSNEKL